MSDLLTNDDIVYAITKDDVQQEAMEQIGRKLTKEEMLLIEKRLHYGIGENLLLIYPAIFEEFK